MKILIKATNFDLTPNIESQINEKLGSIAKFIPEGTEPLEMRVEVGLTSHGSGDSFRAEANLRIHSDILRSEATGKDVFMAINEVKDQLQRIVKRYKGKNNRVSKVDFETPFE